MMQAPIPGRGLLLAPQSIAHLQESRQSRPDRDQPNGSTPLLMDRVWARPTCSRCARVRSQPGRSGTMEYTGMPLQAACCSFPCSNTNQAASLGASRRGRIRRRAAILRIKKSRSSHPHGGAARARKLHVSLACAWAHGCVDAWMPGCMDAGMRRCICA